jgi:hypothetical protein
MFERLAGARAATYIDTGSWFCTADGRCPGFVGNTAMRRDAAGPVVPAYAQRLASLQATILGPPRR